MDGARQCVSLCASWPGDRVRRRGSVVQKGVPCCGIDSTPAPSARSERSERRSPGAAVWPVDRAQRVPAAIPTQHDTGCRGSAVHAQRRSARATAHRHDPRTREGRSRCGSHSTSPDVHVPRSAGLRCPAVLQRNAAKAADPRHGRGRLATAGAVDPMMRRTRGAILPTLRTTLTVGTMCVGERYRLHTLRTVPVLQLPSSDRSND